MSDRLRIATFNLENLDDRPGLEPPLSERIAVMRPQLLRLEADVLCLQEVNGQHLPGGGSRQLAALDQLIAETPYAGFDRAVTMGPDGHGPADVHNLVLLSRFPIAAAKSVRHERVRPPNYQSVTAKPPLRDSSPVEWDRPILLAAITLPGDTVLHVLNLHLRAPLAAFVPGQKRDSETWTSISGWAEGFFLATIKRTGQALEARLLIEEIFDQDQGALIAVVGDFNAEERETPLRTLRGDADDTGNSALVARSLISLERSLPQSRRYSVVYHGERAMLDHILVSRALLAAYRHIEIHNETLGDEMVTEHVASPESHHAPIVAEFAL